MPLVKTLGSLWFAIILISSLALLLCISTFLESVHGTPYVQKMFYNSIGFDLFLALVAVNIVCSALTRIPFKKHHTGFVVTHIGILLLLFGAFLARIGGVEGQMTLYEGEEKEHMLKGGEDDDVGATRRVAPTEGTSKDPFNPAVRATLSSERVGLHETFFLIAKDPENPHAFFTDIGPAHIELKTDDGAGTTRRPPRRSGRGIAPTLRITQKITGQTHMVEIKESTISPVPLGQTDLKISNIHYYPNAKVAENRIANSPSDVPFNPAVEFEVSDSRGRREQHTQFLLFPDFPSLRGGEANNVFNLDTELVLPLPEDSEESKAPSFIFYAHPDGKWEYQIFSSKNAGARLIAPLPMGQPISTGWMDMTMRVEKVFSRAKTAEAAIHKLPLPFRLALKDFRKIDYPGTSSPASFESDVVLTDEKEKLKIEKTIRMNKPLDYKGYRIFQSSYIQDPEAGEASVFTIAKNPGIRLIYSGALIILAGVAILFYLHPAFSSSGE